LMIEREGRFELGGQSEKEERRKRPPLRHPDLPKKGRKTVGAGGTEEGFENIQQRENVAKSVAFRRRTNRAVRRESTLPKGRKGGRGSHPKRGDNSKKERKKPTSAARLPERSETKEAKDAAGN